MKFGQIFECDIANGEGCRTSLFVSGCTHHCKECFNPQTWDFDFGQEYTKETEDFIVDSLRAQQPGHGRASLLIQLFAKDKFNEQVFYIS